MSALMQVRRETERCSLTAVSYA